MEGLAGCIGFTLFCAFIPCIIWGSISASYYVRYQNIRKIYTNTSCLLVNYTSHKYRCGTCYRDGCDYYQCFNELFTVQYPIWNNTYITSDFATFASKNRHEQREV